MCIAIGIKTILARARLQLCFKLYKKYLFNRNCARMAIARNC